MDDLVQRLRAHQVWMVADAMKYIPEAADEIERLRAQLAEQQAAAAWCEKHQPKGGARGQCVICAGYALSAALSKISYLCGKPNEMGASIYDVDCDEDAVVERVKAMRAQLAERDRDAEYLRWRLNEILPLFEEARDALPAISIAAAKLHRVDLSLGDRMDKAGTRTRAEFDAAIDAAMAPKP